MHPRDLLQPGDPIDLTNCDREPIHIPGAIQPHGALLAATIPGLVVVQASANTQEILGLAHGAALGANLATILDASTMRALAAIVASDSVRRVETIRAEIGGRAFHTIIHRSGGVLVVDIEPPNGDAIVPAYSEQARDAIVRIQSAGRLADLWVALADVVRTITGFDRVMVYRFAPDGSGHVIAEARGEGVESFLDLWYPASDIPQQARALYVQDRVRQIVDAAYVPVPIVPALCPVTGAALDLTRSTLRSVSPIHCRYLANMGVRASMSISLVHEERLWGLIACHHLSPRFISYHPRVLCALIGDIASWVLGPKLAAEQAATRIEAAAVRSRLVERMSAQSHLGAALVAAGPSALDLVEARGFAAVHAGAIVTAGRTPSLEDTKAILDWLRTRVEGAVYATDSLAAVYPPANDLQETASGLLAAVVSKASDLILVWFRPEAVREVRWAGDPRKPVDLASGELSPRRSFALWQETVRGRSLPWAAWELEAAEELRTMTAGVILQKAAEIWSLNVDLKNAVRSRDDLIAMASHELRTPATTLKLQLASLRRLTEAGSLSREDALARLDKVGRQIDRVVRLIDQLLDVSRITSGRLELDRTAFDLADLARELVERDDGDVIAFHAEGDTRGFWDRLRLEQVLTNLLTNARKFGGGKPIDVTIHGAGDRVIVEVRDRGIGISAEARGRIFERFERAVSPRHFAGFGLGLWIVRRVVEAHGGRINVDSAPGQGSTFTLDLPR